MAGSLAVQLSERIVRIPLIEAAGKAFGPDVVEIHQLSPEIKMEQIFSGYLQYLEYCVQVQASNNTPEDVH